MADPFLFGLILCAALGSGLVGGIFFAFSTFVMAALDRIGPERGIAAMQAINVTVLNGWFLGVFFGTGVICLAAVFLALADPAGAATAGVITGAALYLVGTIAVTVARNVPLNNELAAVAPDSAAGAGTWARYLSRWTAWNHVRTAAALAASAAFILALR